MSKHILWGLGFTPGPVLHLAKSKKNGSETGNHDDITTNGAKLDLDHEILVQSAYVGLANEISKVNGDDSNVAHDLAGNMTKVPTVSDSVVTGHRKCKYDAWGRLVEVKDDQDNTIEAMKYDGLGRRIRKTITSSGDMNHTYKYFYDGQRVIETHNGSDKVIKHEVYGPTYVDEVVQVGINDNPTGEGSDDDMDEFYTVLDDANFNVVGLMDDDHNLIERREYLPYGKMQVFDKGSGDSAYLCKAEIPHPKVAEIGSPAVAQAYSICDHGHQGLMHDKETGLINNRARYTAPQICRFIGRDPLEYIDGNNLYAYLMNSPGNYLDPWGMEALTAHEEYNKLYQRWVYARIKEFHCPGGEELEKVQEAKAALDAFDMSRPKLSVPLDKEKLAAEKKAEASLKVKPTNESKIKMLIMTDTELRSAGLSGSQIKSLHRRGWRYYGDDNLKRRMGFKQNKDGTWPDLSVEKDLTLVRGETGEFKLRHGEDARQLGITCKRFSNNVLLKQLDKSGKGKTWLLAGQPSYAVVRSVDGSYKRVEVGGMLFNTLGAYWGQIGADDDMTNLTHTMIQTFTVTSFIGLSPPPPGAGVKSLADIKAARAITAAKRARTALTLKPKGSTKGGARKIAGAPQSGVTGQWTSVNEAMSNRAGAYQAQITGRTGQAYVVNGTKFDGLRGNILVDAKGPGYAKFVKNGRFQQWFTGQDGLVEQAVRQTRAAGGARIQWHIADEAAMPAFRNLLHQEGITGIELIHTPVAR